MSYILQEVQEIGMLFAVGRTGSNLRIWDPRLASSNVATARIYYLCLYDLTKDWKKRKQKIRAIVQGIYTNIYAHITNKNYP